MPFQIGPHNRATSRLTLQQSTCWREGSGSRFPILELKKKPNIAAELDLGEFPELRIPKARALLLQSQPRWRRKPIAAPTSQVAPEKSPPMATVSSHPLPSNRFGCCYYPAGNVITAAIARAPHSHTHSGSTPLLGLRRTISVSQRVRRRSSVGALHSSLPPSVRAFTRA